MATVSFACTQCGTVVRKERNLKASTLLFCTRPCFRKWADEHPGISRPKNPARGPRLNFCPPNKLSTEMRKSLVKEYLGHRLNARQVAAKYGVEKTVVLECVREAGLTSKDGTWVEVICESCGKDARQPRWMWRKAKHHYCSPGCSSEGQKLKHTGTVVRRNPFCGAIIA